MPAGMRSPKITTRAERGPSGLQQQKEWATQSTFSLRFTNAKLALNKTRSDHGPFPKPPRNTKESDILQHYRKNIGTHAHRSTSISSLSACASSAKQVSSSLRCCNSCTSLSSSSQRARKSSLPFSSLPKRHFVSQISVLAHQMPHYLSI